MSGHSAENDISIFFINKEYNKLNQDRSSYCEGTDEDDIYNELQNHNISNILLNELRNAMCFLRYKFKNQIDNKFNNIFYIWLGDKIINVVKGEDEFNTTISTCYEILNKAYKGYKIEKPVESISIDHFKKIKLYFDYSINHQIIEYTLNEINYSCTPEQIEYIKRAVATHNEIHTECNSTFRNVYCKIYDNIKSEYTDVINELSTLKCNEYKVPQLDSSLDGDKKSGELFEEQSVLRPADENRYASYKYVYIILLPFRPIAKRLKKLLIINNDKLWYNVKESWREKFGESLLESPARYYDSNVFNIAYFTE
ncbi:variable surface protein [Plasmodium gonderi]|uniref:Variable surface protein n=1 Tax=Plasmodium gonderi TaxID=77519 RepID=A0A1Y1JQK0_PLAGO|nr:variable surface protein [Plasmodium gonderi]GAW84480.1 variable surface protein [Plasmodium gonderi]